jgi:hypothetical protein
VKYWLTVSLPFIFKFCRTLVTVYLGMVESLIEWIVK